MKNLVTKKQKKNNELLFWILQKDILKFLSGLDIQPTNLEFINKLDFKSRWVSLGLEICNLKMMRKKFFIKNCMELGELTIEVCNGKSETTREKIKGSVNLFRGLLKLNKHRDQWTRNTFPWAWKENQNNKEKVVSLEYQR